MGGTVVIPPMVSKPVAVLRDVRPGHTPRVRRTIAGLLFSLAYACACLTVAGFLLQRTAFDPGNSRDAADVVLQDSAIRGALSTFVAEAAAPTVSAQVPGMDVAQLTARVDQIATTPGGAVLMGDIIHDAHARMIGDLDGPVQVTGDQLALATRIEAAAAVPAVELPVPRIGVLSVLDTLLSALLLVTAIAAVVLLGIGITAHPEKSALLRSLALALLSLAVLVAFLGYLVPKFVLPALHDSPWADVPALMADDSLPLLIALDLLLVGGALALLAATGATRRRSRWSAPVSTYRYTEERRWSQ